MTAVKALKDLFDSFSRKMDDRLNSLETNLSQKISRISSQYEGKLHNLNVENINLKKRVSTLESRLINVERSNNLSRQYRRKINVEFDGIPDTVDQNKC